MQWLVDGDLASNMHGWQWAAGCGTDASPYFRIFNPTTQGAKFDPDGDYVRRWVPELRDVATKYVHEPSTHPDGPPAGYPAPMVDHKAERRGVPGEVREDQALTSAEASRPARGLPPRRPSFARPPRRGVPSFTRLPLEASLPSRGLPPRRPFLHAAPPKPWTGRAPARGGCGRHRAWTPSASSCSTTTRWCAAGCATCWRVRVTSTIVGESGSAQEATSRLPALKPDVAVLDARLPDGSGIDVCRDVRSVDPSIKALILTSYDDDEALFAAILAGAAGYLLKQIAGNDLLDGVRRVAAGQSLHRPSAHGQGARASAQRPDRARRAGLADRAGAQDPGPHRRGADQPADRGPPLPGREDREELRLEHPVQARPGATDPGGRARPKLLG